MTEISGTNFNRYQAFVSALGRSEQLNREMNLRFFYLQRCADLASNDGLSNRVNALKDTLRTTNMGFARLSLARVKLEARSAFIRPDNYRNDFDIVSTHEDDLPSGFGAIPLLIGIGVAVVVLVSGSIATVKVCDTVQQKAIADIKIEQLKAEQLFAQSPPATQTKWIQLKQIQQPLLDEIDRLSKNNSGGFLSGVGQSIQTIALFGLAAFVLFKVIGHGEK